ncbi:MAG: hypothetical protein ACRCZ9_08480 [Fusobacteriaceae bacterium]
MVNVHELKQLVETNKGTSIDVAIILGEAKAKMKKSDYKNLIESCDLSKDAVSLSLKRFKMLEVKFTKEFVQDCTDREIKKITHKTVDAIEELSIARAELAKGDISYIDFCEEFDKFKVVKTDDEKLISKAEGLTKFIDKTECKNETLTEVADMFQELVSTWSSRKDGEVV